MFYEISKYKVGNTGCKVQFTKLIFETSAVTFRAEEEVRNAEIAKRKADMEEKIRLENEEKQRQNDLENQRKQQQELAQMETRRKQEEQARAEAKLREEQEEAEKERLKMQQELGT